MLNAVDMRTMLSGVGMIGIEQGLIILAIVLVLFGGKKIPELLRGVGQGVGELQKGLEEGKRQLNQSIQDSHQPTVPAQQTAPAPVEEPKTPTGTPV